MNALFSWAESRRHWATKQLDDKGTTAREKAGKTRRDTRSGKREKKTKSRSKERKTRCSTGTLGRDRKSLGGLASFPVFVSPLCPSEGFAGRGGAINHASGWNVQIDTTQNDAPLCDEDACRVTVPLTAEKSVVLIKR